MDAVWEDIEPLLRVWIEDHEQELVSSIEELISYPSVAEKKRANSFHPFGNDCAILADATRAIVESHGLTWENHSYYAISASYGKDGAPAAGKPWTRPRIAFYSHLDVVPADNKGWDSPPFEPVVRNGWIIGRGSTDNKGPFACVLFALKFLAEQRIELHHDVTLFGGFDEEGSMDDVKWLMEHRPLPQINLVSDCFFPVCIAEKGIVQVAASIRLDDASLADLQAGEAHNMVPSRATATVATQEKRVCHQTAGTPAHSAFPEGSVNALGELARLLSLDSTLKQESRQAFRFLSSISSEHDGRALGIAAHDELLGDTTAVAVLASYENGVLKVALNIRYPAVIDEAHVLQNLTEAFKAEGFAVEVESASKAHFVNPEDGKVKLLTDIVNDELGTSMKPYAMGGATHARFIPGGIGFGPCRPLTDPLPEGMGGAHQVNEAVKIAHLKQTIAIYVRAILALDQQG